MKKRLYLYTISFILLLSLLTVSVFESHAESEHVQLPASFSLSEADGVLNFVFADEAGEVLSEATLEKELPIFCGLYSLDDGYAAVFASCDPVLYRVSLYDMDFNKVLSSDIPVPEASVPFVAGNCSFLKDATGCYYLAVLNLLKSPSADTLYYADQVYILNSEAQLIDSRMHIYDGSTANGMEVSLIEKDGCIYEMVINSSIDQADTYPLNGESVSESIRISNASDRFNELYTLSERKQPFMLHGLAADQNEASEEADTESTEENTEDLAEAENVSEEILLCAASDDLSEETASESFTAEECDNEGDLVLIVPSEVTETVLEDSTVCISEDIVPISEAALPEQDILSESAEESTELSEASVCEAESVSVSEADMTVGSDMPSAADPDIFSDTEESMPAETVVPEESAASEEAAEASEAVLTEAVND